jgi:hypothetical protein
MRMTDLKPGWTVVASDGQRLGTIKEVGQNYVRTSPSLLSSDLYVPASAISNVTDGVVHLSVPLHDAKEMGWNQPPRTDDTLETSPEADLKRHV